MRPSEFSMLASQVARNISTTTAKLQQLTRCILSILSYFIVAKKKSMFDDPEEEIANLSGSVKEEISSITHDLEKLEQSLSAKKDSSSQATENNQIIISRLQSSLKVKTAELQNALQIRHDNLADSQDKKATFGTKLPELSKPATYSSRRTKESPSTITPKSDNLPRPMNSPLPSPPPVYSPEDGVIIPNATILVPTYAQQRVVAMRNIEKQMEEVSQLFSRLANVTALQGEQIIYIDDTVSEAEERVSTGYNKLIDYAESVRNNKSLLIKLFMVVVIFILFLIIFIA